MISLGGKIIDYDMKNKENNSPLAYSLLFKKKNVTINLIQQKVDLAQFVFPLKDRNEIKLKENNYINNNIETVARNNNTLKNTIYNNRGRRKSSLIE